MPFLDEQELASLQQEIHDANVTKDELENELTTQKDELTRVKRKSRGTNLFFGILSGIGLGLATFLFVNKSNLGKKNNTVAFNKQEKQRLIDSIINTQQIEDDTTEDINSVEDDMATVNDNVSNETIYSVQVGVFSKNKYPLLSETFLGTTSQGNIFKYSVGLFETLKEAQDFRRQLVKIGFRDAFVASYKNGERLQIHRPN